MSGGAYLNIARFLKKTITVLAKNAFQGMNLFKLFLILPEMSYKPPYWQNGLQIRISKL